MNRRVRELFDLLQRKKACELEEKDLSDALSLAPELLDLQHYLHKGEFSFYELAGELERRQAGAR